MRSPVAWILVLISTAAATVALGSPALAGGTIEGTIRVVGAPPRLPPHIVAKDSAVCGRESPNDAVLVGAKGALRNVVVSVKGTPFQGNPPPISGAALDQKNCRYIPHVQALTVGTPLSVMNSDATLHNVHANASEMTVFNVAMPIKGLKTPIAMRKPGLMKLQCDAGHTWMVGWIYVFDHPYFAVTKEDGTFSIKDVPPGEHTIELWHEPTDGQGPGVRTTAKVNVVEGQVARLDLSLHL